MGGSLSHLAPIPIRFLFKAIEKKKNKERKRYEEKRSKTTRKKRDVSRCQKRCSAFTRWIQTLCIIPFCPCLVVTEQKKSISGNRRFHSREGLPLRLFKSFLGFTSGVGLSMFFFVFLVNVTQVSLDVATVWSSIACLVLSLGLAFSLKFRCLFFLMLPSLFTSKGRTALLAYAYILTFTGPVVNISQNMKVLTESLSCQQEALKNKTMQAIDTAFAPLIDHWQAIKRVFKAAKEFAYLVREAFKAFLELFKEILGAIKRAWRWLKSILDVCPKLMEMPEQECKKYLAEKQDKCMKIMTILFYLCYLVGAFAESACPLLRAAQIACIKIEMFKERTLEPLKERMQEFFRRIYDGFYFNITTDSYYNYTVNQSQTFSDIAESMMEEIRSRTSGLITVANVGSFILSLGFSLVLIKALFYRWRYLTKDRYDNVYITRQLWHLNRLREQRGQETVLPLGFFESRKYVHPLSPWLSVRERKTLFIATVKIINATVQLCVYLFLDYLLFWLMDRIAFYGRARIAAPVPFRVKLEVNGDGLLADMFKDIVDAFSPFLSSVPALDLSGCLPEPEPPDRQRRKQIIFVLVTTFLLGLARAYGRRMRPMICACYYPEREKKRTAYLYNHILRTRGGFLKIFRRKIRLNRRNQHPEHKTKVLDVLAAKYRLLRWILKLAGYRRTFCLGCGQPSDKDRDTVNPSEANNDENKEKFVMCSNAGCGSLYCPGCFRELEGECTACVQPFEYGDLSDVSDIHGSDKSDNEDSRSRSEDELCPEDYAYQYQRPQFKSPASLFEP